MLAIIVKNSGDSLYAKLGEITSVPSWALLEQPTRMLGISLKISLGTVSDVLYA